MTLEDWLAALAPGDLYNQLSELSDRKLHLLTAAFLRRVWDDLPSHHTRTAVEATEKFADGRTTLDELASLRSTDLLESGELLWVDPHHGDREERLVGQGWSCPVVDRARGVRVPRDATGRVWRECGRGSRSRRGSRFRPLSSRATWRGG